MTPVTTLFPPGPSSLSLYLETMAENKRWRYTKAPIALANQPTQRASKCKALKHEETKGGFIRLETVAEIGNTWNVVKQQGRKTE